MKSHEDRNDKESKPKRINWLKEKVIYEKTNAMKNEKCWEREKKILKKKKINKWKKNK